MLVRIGFHAWLYHNRLRRVATRAESMGRMESSKRSRTS